MDHMCIRTSKVKQLETAAKLSAIQLVECDEYIRLAMCVEQYIANPDDETFNILSKQLSVCTTNFPNFNKSRQSLITNLLNIGYMTKESHPNKKPKDIVPTIAPNIVSSEQPIIYTDNIYSFFTKKKIDFTTKK